MSTRKSSQQRWATPDIAQYVRTASRPVQMIMFKVSVIERLRYIYVYWTEESRRTHGRIVQPFERINGVLYVPPTNDVLYRDKREIIYIPTL